MQRQQSGAREGEIVRWVSEKGFGFIRPRGGGKDVFVHISALTGEQMPRVGTEVVFTVTPDPKGRGERALKVVPAIAGQPISRGDLDVEPRPTRQRGGAHDSMSAIRPRAQAGRGSSTRQDKGRRAEALRPIPMNGLTAFVGGLTLFCFVGAVMMVPVTPIALLAYPLASLIVYFAYARDKLSAIRQTWRVPESSLHLLEALGGWPGAYVAQQTMRHKTVKVSYQVTYWLIVFLHVAFWVTWLIVPDMLVGLVKPAADLVA
jgi:uncharacterized membrane protein YsdA (DUF1294 family)/cold shock CspA family protein